MGGPKQRLSDRQVALPPVAAFPPVDKARLPDEGAAHGNKIRDALLHEALGHLEGADAAHESQGNVQLRLDGPRGIPEVGLLFDGIDLRARRAELARKKGSAGKLDGIGTGGGDHERRLQRIFPREAPFQEILGIHLHQDGVISARGIPHRGEDVQDDPGPVFDACRPSGRSGG